MIKQIDIVALSHKRMDPEKNEGVFEDVRVWSGSKKT